MNPSLPSISAEEREQIIQTIEMFEVIVQTNPTDSQSMEILKDAYQRIGKTAETLGIARQLAETYMGLGQYSSALLEYEGILQQDPDNLEIIAALGEVEERMHSSAAGRALSSTPSAPASTINLDFTAFTGEGQGLEAVEMSGLTTIEQTMIRGGSGRVSEDRTENVLAGLKDDGNAALAKFLIQHQLVPGDIINPALDRVQKFNAKLAANTVAASLLEDITRRGLADLTAIFCGILDRTKMAYIPLGNYDVDRQIVKMLPESLTLGRLIVPFDLISRTVMVAIANPFDVKGKEAVQQVLDYNIQWHLAEPAAMSKILGDAYRLPVSSMKLAS